MTQTKGSTLLILSELATTYAEIIKTASLPDLQIKTFETEEEALSRAGEANFGRTRSSQNDSARNKPSQMGSVHMGRSDPSDGK